jgi:ATP-dependent RNA helicase SUPV3L1/SUV3
MLERLADMLRKEDSRGGFEANPDMLSITGMTLEQFAKLMEGLGYSAVRGTREKVKVVVTPSEEASVETSAESPVETPAAEAEDTSEAAPETASPEEPAAVEPVGEQAPAETAEPAAETLEKPAEDTLDVFYTFAWSGNRGRQQQQQERQGGRPQGKPGGKSGGKPKGKGKPRGKDGANAARNFEARPPRKEKAIDPDNPFAQALMGLTGKKN